MTSTQNDAAKEKKGKWRLSGLMHGDKDKDKAKNNTVETSDHLQVNDSTTDDSTYGSSARNSATGSIPTISNMQAAEQNAPITTRTDKSTGKTIVTTVTTTTTTVTTVDGDKYDVPAGREVRVTETKEEAKPVELSAHPGTPGVHTANSSDPMAGTSTARTRTPSLVPPPPAAVIERYGGLQARDPPSSEDSPVSPMPPSHNNFSYPARAASGQPAGSQQYSQGPASGYGNPSHNQPPAGGAVQPSYQSRQQQPSQPANRYSNAPPIPSVPRQNQQQRPYYDEVPHEPEPVDPREAYQQPGEQPGHPGYNNYGHGQLNQQGQTGASGNQRMGTLQGLKAAAAGIHGAGETLRGTLNSSLERRTGGSAAKIAENDAIAQKGMQEIESGKFAGKHHYAPPSEHMTRQQGEYRPQQQPVQQPMQQPARPGQRYDPLEGAWVPDNPAAGGEAGKKKGGLRNVLRRKDVGP